MITDTVIEEYRLRIAEHSRLVTLDKRHSYWVAGDDCRVRRVPGVTTVIKSTLAAPRLEMWKQKMERQAGARVAWEVYRDDMPADMSEDEFMQAFLSRHTKEYEAERIAREKADIGTGVHKLIEKHQRGMMGQAVDTDVSDESLWAYAGWEDWARINDLVPVAMEGRVYSSTFNYAGSFDWLGMFRGRLAIIDWKPKAPYPEYRLQVAAYANAVFEILKVMPETWIVTIPREGGAIETHDLTDGQSEAFEAFLGLLAIHRWSKAVEKADA